MKLKILGLSREKDAVKYLTFALVFGIVLMSVGVYLVGMHVPYGNVLLTVASAVVYISVIAIALKA
jgi:hypothetical protein